MRFLSSTPPPSFLPTMETAICICEHKDKNLFLQRSAHKPYPGQWSAPGGKLEQGETPEKAAVRELWEETGIVVSEKDLSFHGKFYVDLKEVQFIMYLYHAKFTELPKVSLRLEEHSEFLWLPRKEAVLLPLIFGAEECLDKIYTR